MRYPSSAPQYIGSLMIGLATVTLAAGQVPLTKEPRHRVVFETEQFRVLDVNVPPGDTTLDHTHEYDIATVAMSNDASTRTRTPGQEWSAVRPTRAVGDGDVAEHTGKSDRHVVQNVGKVPYQLFAVENLRKGNWTTGAALTAPGTAMTAESRAFRLYDVRLVPNLTQIHHVHATTAIALLIRGRAMSAGEESKTAGTAPIGLKQLVQAGEWVLVPAGQAHHLVRLGTEDARVIEIEVR
jgi:quercetin dioxygenase-like cupin family protein